MDTEQLDALLIENGVDWDRFMDAPDGDIYLGQVLFSFRVGLYFEKPYEVIMACKQFVRMRRIEAWGQYELKKLNSERPSACLYSLPDEKNLTQAWKPTRLKRDTDYAAQVAAMQAAQAQMLYSQQYQQYAGNQTLTGLMVPNYVPTTGTLTTAGYATLSGNTTTLSQSTLPISSGVCGTSNTSGS